MTGMERNSDMIVMASYAPLLVNVNPGGMQWESDLIGYDAMSSYGSPSYYAQTMFGGYLGTEVPTSSLEGASDRFFYSVTNDPAKGKVFLKLVNASSVAQANSNRSDGCRQRFEHGYTCVLDWATTMRRQTPSRFRTESCRLSPHLQTPLRSSRILCLLIPCKSSNSMQSSRALYETLHGCKMRVGIFVRACNWERTRWRCLRHPIQL